MPFTTYQSCIRRGFSLIEAAIVLGIVGLVIGGIWVAASTVRDRMKYDDMLKGIGFIASSISQKIPGSTYLTAPQQGGNGVSYLQHYVYARTAIDMGVIPKDWIQGSNVVTPYGDNLEIYIVDTNRFEINFRLPTADCLRFAVDQMNLPHFWGGTIGGNSFIGTDTTGGGYPMSFRKAGCTDSNSVFIGTLITFERP